MNRFSLFVLAAASALALPVSAATTTPDGKGFSSSDAAAQALVNAARANDANAVLEILGPSSKSLVTTHDTVADKKELREFAVRAGQKMTVVSSPGRPNSKTLLVGQDEWPMPIPLVKVNGQWYFDTAQGKTEILNRRIGGNELDAIDLCRGFVEAEDNYAGQNRTANNVPIYAQKIISSAGQRDGLYWPSTGEDDESPMGDIVARALAEGYTNKHEPFHGYYFRVLTGQGQNAEGGAMSYIDNGAMTKGFAVVAWPSNYGSTGIMTFLVSKTGIVYQKNLGPKTAELAGAYSVYNPDKTWSPVSNPSTSQTVRRRHRGE
jgi:Protein of unknown function (DUF2950)